MGDEQEPSEHWSRSSSSSSSDARRSTEAGERLAEAQKERISGFKESVYRVRSFPDTAWKDFLTPAGDRLRRDGKQVEGEDQGDQRHFAFTWNNLTRTGATEGPSEADRQCFAFTRLVVLHKALRHVLSASPTSSGVELSPLVGPVDIFYTGCIEVELLVSSSATNPPAPLARLSRNCVAYWRGYLPMLQNTWLLFRKTAGNRAFLELWLRLLHDRRLLLAFPFVDQSPLGHLVRALRLKTLAFPGLYYPRMGTCPIYDLTVEDVAALTENGFLETVDAQHQHPRGGRTAGSTTQSRHGESYHILDQIIPESPYGMPDSFPVNKRYKTPFCSPNTNRVAKEMHGMGNVVKQLGKLTQELRAARERILFSKQRNNNNAEAEGAARNYYRAEDANAYATTPGSSGSNTADEHKSWPASGEAEGEGDESKVVVSSEERPTNAISSATPVGDLLESDKNVVGTTASLGKAEEERATGAWMLTPSESSLQDFTPLTIGTALHDIFLETAF